MTKRTRDPARADKILEAAAGLFAERGYHAVSLAEIGERAGITGSGIYRHFANKAAILTRLFDDIIDDLLEQGRQAVEGEVDLESALQALIRGQVAFVVEKRELAQIYHNEITSLSEEDRVRLRRKQRMYLEEWAHLLAELTDYDEAVTRTRVFIAVGAIQSVLFHRETLPPEPLSRMLTSAAGLLLRADL